MDTFKNCWYFVLVLMIFHQYLFLSFFVRAVTARLHIPHAEELLNSDSKKKKFLVECESLEPTIEKPWPRFRDFQVVPILNILWCRYVQTTFNVKCSTITICTTGSPWLPTLLPKWATSKNKKAWKTWWVDFGFCHVDKISLRQVDVHAHSAQGGGRRDGGDPHQCLEADLRSAASSGWSSLSPRVIKSWMYWKWC